MGDSVALEPLQHALFYRESGFWAKGSPRENEERGKRKEKRGKRKEKLENRESGNLRIC
jgi:hypothetical protein